MRCGCPHCEAFMVQEDERSTCVCPDCGYRCDACLGTGTAITREQLAALRDTEWFKPDFESAPCDEDAEHREVTTSGFPGVPTGFSNR